MNRHDRRALRRQGGCWAAYTTDGRPAAHQPAECDGSCGGSVAQEPAAVLDEMERHLQRAYGPGGPGHDPDPVRQRAADLWTLAMFGRADLADAAQLWRRALGLLQLHADLRQDQLTRLTASWSRRRASVRPPAGLAALVLACPRTGPPARPARGNPREAATACALL